MRPMMRSLLKPTLWLVAMATGSIILVSALALERIKVPPRELAPYVERRASGHNPFIVNLAAWIGQTLLKLDRGEYQSHAIQALTIGAQAHVPQNQAVAAGRRTIVLVASAGETVRAIASARPGDVITLLPGKYLFDHMGYIEVSHPGAEAAPITVRAETPDTVFLEFNMAEGFKVSAPYWTFENLHIHGACEEHGSCEHAFHIVGKGGHFIARNNTITDFNAHFKINAENHLVPDFGTIEGNTLSNSGVRRTDNPVAPVDLVAASHWRIRRNLITDFVKAQGDRVSYGVFAKGAGSDNDIEQNIVICENLLRDIPGQRIGISLGGGGTGGRYCRDQACIAEQYGSTIRSNLIASCSDDGIYVNRAASSRVAHNSLIDTGGISVRFVESSADVRANLVDGLIRARDGALLRATDNLDTSALRLYLGSHPVRDLYVDAASSIFAWNDAPPRQRGSDDGSPDLCQAGRSSDPVYGAFRDFSACLATK
jgi:hypothetical protein